jgi:hypothetical protein
LFITPLLKLGRAPAQRTDRWSRSRSPRVETTLYRAQASKKCPLVSMFLPVRTEVTVPQRSARKLTVIDFRPLVHGPLGLLNNPHMAY